MEDSTSPTGSPLAATEQEQTPPNITEQAPPAVENPEPEQVLLSPPTEEKSSPGKDEEGDSVAELSKEEGPAPEPSASELPEASAPEQVEASASELSEASVPAPAPADEVSEVPAPAPAPAPADEVSEAPVPAPAAESEASEPHAPASVNSNGNATEANGEAENQNTAPEVVTAEKPQEKKDEDSMPPEVDSVVVPSQWHAKPCLHVTSIGGFISQEQHRCKQSWMEGCCL